MINYIYYTLKQCKELNLIPLSIVQIRRRIKEVLYAPSDKRAVYQKINGKITILLEKQYAKSIQRIRKKHSKQDITVGLIKTEITIHFAMEFNNQSLASLVSFYPSKHPLIYVIEGKNSKKHLHMGVCEDINQAKELVMTMLDAYYIPLMDTDVKISPMIDLKKFSNYVEKYDILNYHNFTNMDFTIDYKTQCELYLKNNPSRKSLISPYKKKHFTNEVFKHKLGQSKKCR
ncbi:hypothetical protein ACPDHL_11975 [Myroides sp. C15-4]|uniref:hypothetical protein n=1 Tax=Myroides sp. C15-4 TaxID=3400532 RepID=UPI003D2F67A0